MGVVYWEIYKRRNKEENRVWNEVENYYFVQKEAFFMIIKNKNSEAGKRIFCYFFKSKEVRTI